MSGGDHSGSLALVIMAVIVLLILGVAAGFVYLSYKAMHAFHWPGWVLGVGAVAGIVLGVYVTFFVVFDDLGRSFMIQRSAPPVTLIVPDQFVGRLLIFFDPAKGVLERRSDKSYVLEVPSSGNLLTGVFPGDPDVVSYIDFKAQYKSGAAATMVLGGNTGGGVNNIRYITRFVGSEKQYEEEYERRRNSDRPFDEEDVLKKLQNPVDPS